MVPVQHSYLLGMALAAAAVPHELHVLPGSVHGVGLAADAPAGAWARLCADWLGRLPHLGVPGHDFGARLSL